MRRRWLVLCALAACGRMAPPGEHIIDAGETLIDAGTEVDSGVVDAGA
ncbi:MAG: hypothetical protein JNG84_01730, partial [Archangium sp.]|nr:hypothetical protein [Archangium sp.]